MADFMASSPVILYMDLSIDFLCVGEYFFFRLAIITGRSQTIRLATYVTMSLKVLKPFYRHFYKTL